MKKHTPQGRAPHPSKGGRAASPPSTGPHFALIDGRAVPCLALPPEFVNFGFSERIAGKIVSRLEFITFRKRDGKRALRFRWSNLPALTEAEQGFVLDLMKSTVAAATRTAKAHRRRLQRERRNAKKGTAKK